MSLVKGASTSSSTVPAPRAISAAPTPPGAILFQGIPHSRFVFADGETKTFNFNTIALVPGEDDGKIAELRKAIKSGAPISELPQDQPAGA